MNLGPRFWSKVDKSAGPDGCWLWTAAVRGSGYGAFGMGKSKVVAAHRLAYVEAFGEIPDGMEVDHRCRNRKCVNSAHLRLTTHKQNLENQAAIGRNSASGVRGVHKHPDGWEAVVKHHGVKHYGGLFRTVEEAASVAAALRARLFTHNNADLVGV